MFVENLLPSEKLILNISSAGYEGHLDKIMSKILIQAITNANSQNETKYADFP